MSSGNEILYLDAVGVSADATVAGLALAGYRVRHFASAETFEVALRESGPQGNGSLAALIIDLSHDEDAGRRAAALLETELELPKVFLIRAEQSAPTGERVMVLKRPVTTPALIRLLDFSLDNAPDMSMTGVPILRTGSQTSLDMMEIGDYELVEKIASGGMGTVFVARRSNQTGFSRLYAVKLMHPHLVGDVDLQHMFLDEATLASRIHHPNVAATVDMGLQGDRPYLVLQYVEGCSLAELFRATPGPRPIELVVSILIDALSGLRAAHELVDEEGQKLGIVHRDVSPDNILVGLDGVARITDFGVAKARGRLTSTRKGVRKGKLLYLAPEQLGDSADLDARVDLFAAGAVLWQGLTGRRLFQADSPAAVMRNVMEADILPPSALNPAVPEVLDDVCLRALSRDLEGRYGSAKTMLAALRAAATETELLGSHEAVGRWVDDAQGDALRARRKSLQAAGSKGVPGSMPLIDVDKLGGGTLVASESSFDHVFPAEASAPEPASTTSVAEGPSRERTWGVAVVAALLGTAIAASVTVMTCGDKAPNVEVDEGAVAPAEIGRPSPPPPAAASSDPTPKAAPVPALPVQPDPVPSEVTPSEVTPSEVIPSEVAPDEVTPRGSADEPPAGPAVAAVAPKVDPTAKRRRAKRRRKTVPATKPVSKPAVESAADPKPAPKPAVAEQPPPSPPKRAVDDPLAGGPALNPYKGT